VDAHRRAARHTLECRATAKWARQRIRGLRAMLKRLRDSPVEARRCRPGLRTENAEGVAVALRTAIIAFGLRRPPAE
jgi:hypothetical protein